MFDTSKFPGAYKIDLPTPESYTEKTSKELYIPRAISRQTFADPTAAGGKGVSKVQRKLQNLLNKARSFEAYRSVDESYLLESDKDDVPSFHLP